MKQAVWPRCLAVYHICIPLRRKYIIVITIIVDLCKNVIETSSKLILIERTDPKSTTDPRDRWRSQRIQPARLSDNPINKVEKWKMYMIPKNRRVLHLNLGDTSLSTGIYKCRPAWVAKKSRWIKKTNGPTKNGVPSREINTCIHTLYCLHKYTPRVYMPNISTFAKWF